MQEKGFTENDWKLFRNKIADWQEAYMDRLNMYCPFNSIADLMEALNA